jgi:outer membrane protein OmpA-like peptidoglycan-associated protein
MNRVKILVTILILLFTCSTMQAQFGKKLGKTIENAAKNATERKAAQKTDEAVSKSIDKATNPDTYKDEDGKESKKESSSAGKKAKKDEGDEAETSSEKTSADKAPQGLKAAEMAYAKSDFVAGDEIIFDDDLANEQLGEFPSQWDLINGVAEVATIDGVKAIYFEGGNARVTPLMKDMKNYLPEIYTIEMDFWMNKPNSGKTQGYNVSFYKDGKTGTNDWVTYLNIDESYGKGGISWRYRTPDNEIRDGNGAFTLNPDAWHHLAISFNKRALKIYVDGIRMANVPSVMASTSFRFHARNWGTPNKFVEYLTNVRIAKGAVPLYDRMLTDGKFITYGITFDVGKSVIKPESMGEINRIVKLMTDNPELKFSVEGHTDATGNAASNQTLSDARSKAVVDKLVEMGIAVDRLKSAGKGQTAPIADNSTDEGRAKNRRVEFVSIKN